MMKTLVIWEGNKVENSMIRNFQKESTAEDYQNHSRYPNQTQEIAIIDAKSESCKTGSSHNNIKHEAK